MRVNQFARWVLQVGNGKLMSISKTNVDAIEIPPKCIVSDTLLIVFLMIQLVI